MFNHKALLPRVVTQYNGVPTVSDIFMYVHSIGSLFPGPSASQIPSNQSSFRENIHKVKKDH